LPLVGELLVQFLPNVQIYASLYGAFFLICLFSMRKWKRYWTM